MAVWTIVFVWCVYETYEHIYYLSLSLSLSLYSLCHAISFSFILFCFFLSDPSRCPLFYSVFFLSFHFITFYLSLSLSCLPFLHIISTYTSLIFHLILRTYLLSYYLLNLIPLTLRSWNTQQKQTEARMIRAKQGRTA